MYCALEPDRQLALCLKHPQQHRIGLARHRAAPTEGEHMARKKNRNAGTNLRVWIGPTTLLLKLLIEIFKH